jgi:hypothetical protein
MTFKCKYLAEDYIRAYRTYAATSSRRWIGRFCWVMAVLMLFIAVVGSFAPKAKLSTAIPLFLLAAMWIYLATALWGRAGRRAFVGRPELAQDYEVNVDESGIAFNGPITKHYWSWPAFTKFTESNETFLAYLSPCAFVIFPKRILGSEQIDHFREFLRQKLPAK